MASVELSPDLDRFVRAQIESGHFKDAADVVAAGLRLLEESVTDRAQHRDRVLASIIAAYDDPAPRIPADAVFDRLERLHAERARAGTDDA